MIIKIGIVIPNPIAAPLFFAPVDVVVFVKVVLILFLLEDVYLLLI